MILILAASAVIAPEYLTSVVSEPFQTTGTATEIAVRAETCAARLLYAGVEGGELIVSSSPATGVVVARNSLEYRDNLVPWRIRSRMTVEARDGRFRISHGEIERYTDPAHGTQLFGGSPWGPIGKWRFSGWQKAEAALIGKTGELAACIHQPASVDAW